MLSSSRTRSSTCSDDGRRSVSARWRRASMMAAFPLAGGELHFPAGLIGLPELRRFGVQPVEGTDLLELVSLDDPGFGFVAAMADDVRAGVSDELRSRGVASPDEPVIVFLAVHGD